MQRRYRLRVPHGFIVLGEGELKNMALVDGLLAVCFRDSHYVYPSKIGGLIRIRDNSLPKI